MNKHASMNRAFRLVWNEARDAWVPAAETAPRRGKRTSRSVALLAAVGTTLTVAQLAHAASPPSPTTLPTGGKVVAGTATLTETNTPTSAVLNVDQTTQRAVIDWNTFNLGSSAQVNFDQPNSQAVTLNRVLDSNPSQIFGKLTAPGQIFLTNPNGVYFGKSASVDVGGLTATTSSIDDADFMSGKTTLRRNGATGSVINEGHLTASLGGYIALLAPEVRNSGVIVARMGTVALAAGDAITLDFDGHHLTGLTAQPSTIAALVENRSAVLAPGGLIILSAKAADTLQAGVIHNTGTLEATGLSTQGGRIVLEASSRIDNSGTISANAGADGSPAGKIDIAAPEIVNTGSITAAVPAAAAQASQAIAGGRITLSAETITQTAAGVLDASGANGGSVTLDATQAVSVAGRISSVGLEAAVTPSATAAQTPVSTAQGGTITITAGREATLQDATLDVAGSSAGGQIQVQGGRPDPANPSAPDQIALLGATQLNASSRRGKGGTVILTAGQVALLDTTNIDAAGATGGGAVYVGGGFHGQNPSIANAQQTTIAKMASIDASATTSGDGGRVAVWSDELTEFAGHIDARGGANSGKGGFVEVSGKRQLDFLGFVDAGSTHGASGTLLLDPQDIVVDANGTDTVANETFATNPAGSSLISPVTITTITNAGTGVVLQANDDITINSSIQTTGAATGGSLTFQAGRNITVNASVISNNGNITFSANDAGATAADRQAGNATFTNNSLINAGTGNVSISMGALGASGNISTGHITATNLSIANTGTTAASTTIDLGETDLTGTLTISAAAANPNLTNSLGTVTVHGTSTINVGTGNVTITNPNTDFTMIGLTAGNVTLINAGAVQFATTNVASISETTNGPIAQTGPIHVATGGAASFTANNGAFGVADPFISFTNASNHFGGTLALNVPSAGNSGTGGQATITDSGSIDIISSSTARTLQVTAGGAVTTGPVTSGQDVNIQVNGAGAVSLGAMTVQNNLTVSTSGAITQTGALNAPHNITILTAGSANDITLDNPSNTLNFIQIGSANNVTLVNNRLIDFINTSTISGNLNVTSAGDIDQTGSPINVAGATTFTANGSAPINLFLGPNNPFSPGGGFQNNFAGTVTLQRTGGTTGFSTVELRNINASASVLSGLTSVGTLSGVALTFDNAASVTLPGMTVNGNLLVNAPSVANTATHPANIISQTGPIVVSGDTNIGAGSSGDIVLNNAANNFTRFGVSQSNNTTVVTSGALVLVANFVGDEHINGNYSVTAGGNITDSNSHIFVTNGTASFNAGPNNVTLTQDNVWSTVSFIANNVTINSNQSLILGNSTISGTLSLNGDHGGTLTEASGATVLMTSPTATATFNNFSSGITLTGANNVFGPIAISSSGAVAITENDAITQAQAWTLNTNGNVAGLPVTLTTTNDQAITLNQNNNYLGPLTITQVNSGATSAGAVLIRDNGNSNSGLTQGASPWTVHGALQLDSGSFSINLSNPNNVLGPLEVTGGTGTTNGVTSSVTLYAKNTASTDAITDVGSAGAWNTGTGTVKLVAYDSTGTNTGGGNITLTNPGNVLGNLYVKGHNVTITENGNITDGPNTVWNTSNDTGWVTTGTTNLVVANPTGRSISLSNITDQLGPVGINTTGTAGTLSSVLITTNGNLAQGSVWNIGTTPVTVDARAHQIDLSAFPNVLGPITINTINGTPTSVAITENDAITQGNPWVLTGVPVTLVAQNGNAITLTNATNQMGNLTVTGGAVSITENGNITQGGAWTTTGTTTLNPTASVITLTNPNNILGPIAIAGTPSAVNISENANIAQASAWNDPSTPFTLNAGTHDILLTQAGNAVGALTLTGQDATVTESNSGGITEGAAWHIPGTTTLNAGNANPIVLNAIPSNSLGTVDIIAASNAEIDVSGAVNFGTSAVATGGTLTVSAGGLITQSGPITATNLRLIGTGNATLTNAANAVSNLAAGFSGGDLTFTDAGSFAVAVIGGTSGITIGGNNVTLTSLNGTVTGLTNVNASSGSLSLTTGTALTLPQITIAGPQTYTASTVSGTGITLTAGVTSTAPGAITFNSPVTLAAALSIQTDNSPVTFVNTVAGGSKHLDVNAGSGVVNFNAAVSGLGATTDASAALSVESGGATLASTLSANNGLAITGPVTFNDTVTLADGSAASVFTGLVTLGKAGGMTLSGFNNMSFDGGVLLQNGPATIESNNSPLSFLGGGTVSGPFALTLDSGTAAITGLDHMGSNLTGLTVTALSPTIPGGGISIAGPQTYTATSGSNITLAGNVSSTAAGAIAFDSPVTVGANSTVSSTNSPVVFGSTVDGAHNLSVNAGTGSTTFTNAVGGTFAVGSGTGAALSLQGTGTTTFDSTLQTRSGITAVGPVVFDGNATLGNGNTGSTFGGLVTTGGSSGNTITGSDGIAFNGGLTLTGGPVTVNSNGSTMSFGGPVSGSESLTLNALSAGAGTVSGLDQIGPSSNLTALTVTAQTLSLPSAGLAVAGPMSFTAPGGITLNGAVGNASSPATGQISFTGPVTLATGPVTVASANAPINFSGTVDGAEALTANAGTAATTFASALGSVTPLTSLSTGSGPIALNGGGITTTGGQTYNGAVTLGANSTLAGQNVTFASTIDGAHALTVNDAGTTTVGGAVGRSTALTSVHVNAGAIAVDTPSVTTTGSQTYAGSVTLGSDASFNGIGIAFNGSVDGAHSLTANAGSGTLAFQGNVGNVTPVAALSGTANTITVGNATTTGAQTYAALAGLTLNGTLNTTNSAVMVTGPTTLGADSAIHTNGGNILFSGTTSTIDGAHNLALAAGTGNVTLGGVVGGGTALSGISVSGFDLSIPDVTTASGANQSYTALDNLTLTQSRTVDAPISFTADADGDGHGSFILPNNVSLTASNNSLSITAADINLQGNSTLSSGTGVTTITATDGLNIFVGGTTPAPGQMTITGSELSRISTSGGLTLKTSGGGAITVDGILAAQSQNITGPLTFDAQGTGAVSFVTAPSTFNAVTAEALGGTINVGVNLTALDRPIEFVTPVSVSGASTISSGGGNISFDDRIAVDNNLTLSTANGLLAFSGPVGSTSTLTLNLGGGSVAGLSELQNTLTGLTVNGTAGITLPALAINGPQVYNTGPITLTGDLSGIGLTFNNVVDAVPASGSALLSAGTGQLAFNGLASFNAVNMTLTADAVSFSRPVSGTGALTIQPFTNSANVAVGGSGTPITGLNLTAAALAELPTGNLSSLTIGSATGTGSLDVAGNLNASSTALTLNGGAGITQSGGAITSGPLTLSAAGGAIDLPNANNAFGAVALGGAPSTVTLTNSKDITQQGSAGWNLGTASLALNAGAHNIILNNAGNTSGTLTLQGANAQIAEVSDTDIGASNISGNLTVNTTGAITVSGALAANHNVSFTAGGTVTQSAPLTIVGNLSVVTTANAGDVTIDNSGATATSIGNTDVGGNYTLTATGQAVTQAPTTAVQVDGNLTVTGTSITLGGVGNLIGGTTTLPASSTVVLQASGVISLGDRTASNLTVISERTNRSFGSSPVHGSAIVLSDSSNDIHGTISVSASPPTVQTGTDVQTGIVQDANTSVSVAGVASFTAEPSGAGSLGVVLTNAGNKFGVLQVSGTTVNVANASTGTTTLASSTATNSITLTTAGAVDQAGAIVTPSLSVASSGTVLLNNAANAVGTLQVSSGGNPISFVNDTDLSVAGINAGGSSVSLSTTGTGSITQTGALQNVGALTVNAGGAVNLTNTSNSSGSLGTSLAGSGFQLYNSGPLAVAGTVTSTAGDLRVRTTGDLTLLNSAALVAEQGNVIASTEGAGNFINDSSAAGAALVAGMGDRWLVYSDAPDLVAAAHTVKNGLTSNFRHYGATFSSYGPTAVTESGNGFIYDFATPTLTVNSTIVGTPSQVYGDNPTGHVGVTISAGLVDSEDNIANVITGGTATFSQALSNTLNAGIYNITYTGGLTSNYTLMASPTGSTYTVTPAVLTYTANPVSRTYGAANPTLGGTLTGFKLGQDASVLGGSLTWMTTATPSSNVGQYAITGSGYSSSGNYTFAQSSGNATAFTINPAALTITAANDVLTYDGTGFSGGNGVTFNGFVLGQDSTALNGTLTFTGNSQGARNVGTYTIAPAGLTSGNYAIAFDNGTLTINKANLSLTTSNVTKTYNGTLAATGTAVATGGAQLLGGDTVSGGTYAFTNANAGTGDKTVTVSGVTVNDSNSGGNYNVTYVNNTTSTINPASLAIEAATVTKTYDGTLTAGSTPTLVSGTLFRNVSNGNTQDSLSGGTFAFTNADAGSGNKTVTASGVAVNDGNGGGNYNVTYVNNTTSTINPASLTIEAATVTKTYDGTLTAGSAPTLVSGTLFRNVSNGNTQDSLSGGTFAFSNADAGTGNKTVTASGVAVNDGNGGGNYNVTYVNNTTSTINPASLTIEAATVTKTYDGTLTASSTPTVISGTLFRNVSNSNTQDSLSGGTFAFTNANAGSGDKTVTVSGVTVSDGDGGRNYNVTYANNTTSTINPASLTIEAANVAKTYDGTLTAGSTPTLVSGTLFRNVSNGNTQDSLSGGTFAFTNADAGSGNKTVTASGVVLSDGNGGGNYNVTYVSNTTSTINPASLTIEAATVTKTYDGTLTASSTPTVISGTLFRNVSNGNTQDSLSGGTFAFTNADAGTGNKTVTASGVVVNDGNSGGNYNVTYVNNTTSTINPASLTIEAATVTKTYDGTLTASSTPTVISGTLYRNASNGNAQDSLSGGTYAFTDANAGTADKTVTVSGVTVSDGDGGRNYNVTYVSNTTSTISPASLTIEAANVTKTYDGTLTASSSPTLVSGTLFRNASNGNVRDSLSGGTYAFTDANAGSGDKAVTASGVTLSDGNGGGNYNVTYVNNTTSTINPASVTFTGTVADKQYDGTTAATLAGFTLTGLVGSETLVANPGSANFSDPNAGRGKSVSISGITLSDGSNGGRASNYVVNSAASAIANIDPKILTVDVSIDNKVYDGTTNAVVGSYGLSGFVGNETVGAVYTGSASFATKNAGSAIPVSIGGIQLVNGSNGGLASNYTVPAAIASSANITPAPLRIAGAVVEGKVYDGTTTATVNTQTAVLAGRIGSDDVGVGSLTGTFQSKDAGANIPVAVSTVVLTGADAMDYTLVQPSGLTASITPRSLTVTATGANKVYDGTAAAAVTLSDAPLAGDSVNVGYGSASFMDKNVGTGKLINVSGITLGGADARDYSVSSAGTTSADITPATLVVNVTGANKVYDGTTAGSVTLSDKPIGSDVVNVSYASAGFADKNVGNGKTVNVSGIAATGANAGNYTIVPVATTTADITPATLVVGAQGHPKTFDGNSLAFVTLTDNALPGDQVTVTDASATFADPNVGVGKTITVSGISVSGGADARNYILADAGTTTIGDILDANGGVPVSVSGTWTLPPAALPQSPQVANASLVRPTPPADVLEILWSGEGAVARIPGVGAAATSSLQPASGSTFKGPDSGADAALLTSKAAAGPVLGIGSLDVGSSAAASAPTNGTDRSGDVLATTAASQTNAISEVMSNVDAGVSTNQSLVNADGKIDVALVRAANSPLSGLITVSVPRSVVATAIEFRFPIPSQVTGTNSHIRVSSMNGRALPSWLSYRPETGTFVASDLPKNALPTQILVSTGTQNWALVINERSDQ